MHRTARILLLALILTACRGGGPAPVAPLPPESQPVTAPAPPAVPPAEPPVTPPPAQSLPRPVIHQVDLDGDGAHEQVEWLESQITVRKNDGSVLLSQDLGNHGASPQTFATVRTMPDGARLLFLSAAVRCRPATARAHWLFQSRDDGTLTEIKSALPLCSAWGDLRPGLIALETYPDSFARRQVLRWQSGNFVPEGEPSVAFFPGLFQVSTLGGAVSLLLEKGEEIQGADGMFASPELYQSFLRKVKSGGTWSLGEWRSRDCAAEESIRIPLLRDGQAAGALIASGHCGKGATLRISQIVD